MSLPDSIANHSPLPDAPDVDPGKPSTPGDFYTVLKSLIDERDLCQTAVSTHNEPTTGRPLRRGDHPRYITKLEEATNALSDRLEAYTARFGATASAEMSTFLGLG